MTTQTMNRTKGTSFNYVDNCPYFKEPENKATSAQMVTRICYGKDIRNLHYKIECENLADLRECVKIIDSYNDFDAELIGKKMLWYLSEKQFWNENNPNNFKDLFRFQIGREYSPVIYVEYNELFGNKVVSDHDQAEATETEKPKRIIYWSEYTGDDFKSAMTKFAAEIKADEFTIEEQQLRDKKYYKARFWFD